MKHLILSCTINHLQANSKPNYRLVQGKHIFINNVKIFCIRDIKTNGYYLKDFQFVFIELPKFTKSKVEQLESTIERWYFFFKYAEDTTDEDLRDIVEKFLMLKLTFDELDKFRWNEKDLVAYEERARSQNGKFLLRFDIL